MKIPVEWLREYITTPAGDQELADKLTMAGLEVEEIQESEDGPVYYIKITPNRGDWLSLVGAAREAAAAMDVPLKWAAPVISPASNDICNWANVTVADSKLCPRYGGKVIRNLKHKPTPDWMAKRLLAAGMRPIDIVVDITNYVLLELGQPLHAFDLDTIPDGQIVVRPTQPGEVIVTLDGNERPLPTGSLCICDKQRPICIAGVMGEESTEVKANTKHIFLESAHFDASSIRRTSKLLDLTTEASYRFERTVDPALVPLALERAALLLTELADGEVIPGSIDLYPNPVVPREISLRPKRTNDILGTNFPDSVISNALRRLGLSVADSGDPLLVTVPTFRPDLVKEIDLIEEVGRMTGYDTLPETLPKTPGSGKGDSPAGVFAAKVRNVLAGLGVREVMTHTLAAPSPFDAPEDANKRVAIRSALSAELSGLRQSIIPNLLAVAAHNLRHKTTDVRIFEIGKTFQLGDRSGVYVETQKLALALTGTETPRGWNSADVKPVDYYSAKGLLEELISELRLPAPVCKPHPLHGMHPGRCAVVEINGNQVGFVAEIDPDAVKRDLDVPASVGRIAVFELNAKLLMEMITDNRRYQPMPKFPSINRDLAIVVDRGVIYGDVERAAKSAIDSALLEDLSVQSIYTGDRIAADKKSVAIRFTFRASDRTLTDAEVDAQVASVQTALINSLGAERR